MNYIAHIQIGSHTNTSLLGNFLGDFVKGNQLDYLSPHVEQGVRLHRKIDQFTDQHPLILSLKSEFPSKIRRMAGIVIDVYFDHLLLKHWQRFSDKQSNFIFDQFYTELNDFTLPNNHYFTKVSERLKSHRWLSQYSQADTCFKALISIEKRLTRDIKFADHGKDFVLQKNHLFETIFLAFYPELLAQSSYFIESSIIETKTRDSLYGC